MKWQHFRDPETGQTWMEPVSEPSDEKKLSPELIAEGERLTAATIELTEKIRLAQERLTADIAAKVAPAEAAHHKHLFSDEGA